MQLLMRLIQKISGVQLYIGLAGSICVYGMQGAQSANLSLAQTHAADQVQNFSVHAKNNTGNNKSDNESATNSSAPQKSLSSHNTSHSAVDKKFNNTYLRRLCTWTSKKYNSLKARLPHISKPKRQKFVGAAAACAALLWYTAEKDGQSEQVVDMYAGENREKSNTDVGEIYVSEKQGCHDGYGRAIEYVEQSDRDIKKATQVELADDDEDCTTGGIDNQALCDALKKRDADCALSLIESGVDVRTHFSVEGKSLSPLYAAVCWNNESKVIKALCEKGADANERCGFQHRTPVHMAVVQGSVGALQELCAQGADIHVLDDRGHTPLMLISFAGSRAVNEAGVLISIEMMKVLLEKDRQNRQRESSEFAVQRAFQIRQFIAPPPVVAIIEGYLEKPSLLEVVNNKGHDALYYAARWKFVFFSFNSDPDSGYVDALITYGADCNKQYPVEKMYTDSVRKQYPDGWTLFESTHVEHPSLGKKDEVLRKILVKNAMRHKNKALIKRLCELGANANKDAGECPCCILSRDYYVEKSIKENNIPLITIFCECASELQDQSLKDQLSGYVKEITVEEDAQELKDMLLSLVTSDSVEKENKQDEGVHGLDASDSDND